MNKGQDIQAELDSISSYIAALPRTMPYSVPDEYFNQFGDAVNEHVVQPWGVTLPYSVPIGYFETLTHDAVAMATGNDVILSKEIPYTAPTGYFDALPEQLLRAVNANEDNKTGATIIPLKQGGIFRRIRWVAAAVVMLGIGIGTYFTIFSTQQDNATESMLASVPNSEIQEYVQGTYRLDVNRVVANNDINSIALDNNDIITYLDETGWD